jgi:hypothetical protein
MPARPPSDGFIDPCIPTRAHKPPSGAGWVHEIKHDGHRLIVRRAGEIVRLFTRRGHDWSERYPAIASAAAKLGQVVHPRRRGGGRGSDGVAVFDALHAGTRPATRCLRSWPSRPRRFPPPWRVIEHAARHRLIATE